MNAPTAPTDIVDKLRGSLGWSKSRDQLCADAATEIERLRAALELISKVGGEDIRGGATIQYSATGHLECRRIARETLHR